MASLASSATTGDASKHAWTKKVSENNGQLCFRPPPRVAHASCLDQKPCYLYIMTKKLSPYSDQKYLFSQEKNWIYVQKRDLYNNGGEY